MEDSNPFDNLGSPTASEQEVDDMLAAQNEMIKRQQDYSYLVHKVFSQSRDGKKLMGLWKDRLISQAVFNDSDAIDAALVEGEHRFIRQLIAITNSVSTNKR